MDVRVGRKLWDANHNEHGTVKSISSRFCAVCGQHDCFVVEWPDGKVTKPCTAGVKMLADGDLQIC